MIGLVHGNNWDLLGTSFEMWFVVEVVDFVLLPSFLFLWGARMRNVTLIRYTAVLAVVGIIINRLSVSLIAFNWYQADRYFPRWSEFAITIAIVTVGVLTYRWIVNRSQFSTDIRSSKPNRDCR